MERVSQSKVWKHFTRDYNDDKAKCIHCSQNMSCKSGSTSGLFRHLKSKHNLNSLMAQMVSTFSQPGP